MALLAEEDVEATQTTVSRDLEEIGAVKVRVPGRATPSTPSPSSPSDQVAPEDHLRRVLGEWVVEVAHSANLVVLRTPPGSAHVVGSALDRSGFEGVIGTVAGDDTVLVVAAETPAARAWPPAWPNRRARRPSAGDASTHPPEEAGFDQIDGPDTNGAAVMAKRVVLAYSGGLDTSVAVRWLQEELGVEVVAVAVDVGQGGDFESIRQPGPRRRGGRVVVIDARAEMAEDFVRARPSPPTPATRGSTPSCRRCRARSSCAIWWPRPAATAPTPWPTAARARATTRSASRSGTRALAPDLEILAPGPHLGHDPRGLRRLRRRATRSPSRRPRRSSTRSTRTSGAGPSSAGPSRTPGRRPRPTCTR